MTDIKVVNPFNGVYVTVDKKTWKSYKKWVKSVIQAFDEAWKLNSQSTGEQDYHFEWVFSTGSGIGVSTVVYLKTKDWVFDGPQEIDLSDYGSW